MTCFDVYAWIMFIQVQICILSDVITSGNRELLFRSHNAIDSRRGQQVCLGQPGTFKFWALWSVRDGKGLKSVQYMYSFLFVKLGRCSNIVNGNLHQCIICL